VQVPREGYAGLHGKERPAKEYSNYFMNENIFPKGGSLKRITPLPGCMLACCSRVAASLA
jgi:hypothetical protein